MQRSVRPWQYDASLMLTLYLLPIDGPVSTGGHCSRVAHPMGDQLRMIHHLSKAFSKALSGFRQGFSSYVVCGSFLDAGALMMSLTSIAAFFTSGVYSSPAIAASAFRLSMAWLASTVWP